MAAMTGAIMAGAGLLMSFQGQQAQADASKQAGKYNSDLLKAQAKDVLVKAAEDEKQFRASVRLERGANFAQIGASGITTEGSPMEVLRNNTVRAEEDAMAIRMDGYLRSKNLRNEADFSRKTGVVRANAQSNSATGSLLTGAGSVYRSFT